MPKPDVTEPNFPHIHMKILLENGGTVHIILPMGHPLPRWGEGLHVAHKDFMVTHTCWSFEPDDGKCLPYYRVYVCDQDDWSEDNWPAPPGSQFNGRPSKLGDIDLSPDIEV